MKLSKRLLIAYIRGKFKVLAAVSKKKAAEEAFKLFCTPFLKLKRKYSSTLKNSEDLGFKLNGMKVVGSRWNGSSHKKALILHGFSSAAHNFERYVSPLVKHDYEVLAFDAPAHGISEGKTINAVEYAQMVKEVVKLYGPVQSFITHSFGGLAVCLAMEELPHDEKTRIVLIAPATETTSAIDAAFKMLGLNDELVRKEFDKIILNISGHDPSWFSTIRALKNIKARVLWIHDKEDDVTPYHDAEVVMKEKLPNVEFITTSGLGHRNIYRDSKVIKQVVEFLSN